MKLLDFDYTKKNGEFTKRTIAVVQEPQRFIEGIDVTELDLESLQSLLISTVNCLMSINFCKPNLSTSTILNITIAGLFPKIWKT